MDESEERRQEDEEPFEGVRQKADGKNEEDEECEEGRQRRGEYEEGGGKEEQCEEAKQPDQCECEEQKQEKCEEGEQLWWCERMAGGDESLAANDEGRDENEGGTRGKRPNANGDGKLGHKEVELQLNIGKRRLPSPDIKKVEKERAPEFVVKPRRQFVDEGQTAKFKVSFEGSTATTLTWTKDGKPVSGSKIKTFEQDGYHYLEISEVLAEDSGMYLGTITNSAGTDMASAELDVFEKPKLLSKGGPSPPVIVKTLEDMDLVIGDRDVKFKCEFTGEDVTATWFHNEHEIRQGRQNKCRMVDKVASLTLTEIGEEDGGVYECVLSNKGGEVKTSCTITTQEGEKFEPPVFVKELHDMEVEDGDKVELIVEVKGTQPLHVNWTHNNRPVTVDTPGCVLRAVDGVHSLLVPRAHCSNDSKVGDSFGGDGDYVCEAYNDYGETDTFCIVRVRPKEVVDRPLDPPDFLSRPQNVTVAEGKAATFTCRVKGHPTPSVSWDRQGERLHTEKNFELRSEGDQHSLTINNASIQDAGQYECSARNELGGISHICSLVVTPSPESLPPSSASASIINSSTAISCANSAPVTFRAVLRPSTHPNPSGTESSDNKDTSTNVHDFRGVLRRHPPTQPLSTTSSSSSTSSVAPYYSSRLSQDFRPKTESKTNGSNSASTYTSALASLGSTSLPASKTPPSIAAAGKVSGVKKNFELFERFSRSTERLLPASRTSGLFSSRVCSAPRKSPVRERLSRSQERELPPSTKLTLTHEHSSRASPPVASTNERSKQRVTSPESNSSSKKDILPQRAVFERSTSPEKLTYDSSVSTRGRSRFQQGPEKDSRSSFSKRSHSESEYRRPRRGSTDTSSVEENSWQESISRSKESSPARSDPNDSSKDDSSSKTDSTQGRLSKNFGPALEALKADLSQERHQFMRSQSPTEESVVSISNAVQVKTAPSVPPNTARDRFRKFSAGAGDSAKGSSSAKTDFRSVLANSKQKSFDHSSTRGKSNSSTKFAQRSSDDVTGKTDFRSVLKSRPAVDIYQSRPLSRDHKFKELSKSSPDFRVILARIKNEEESNTRIEVGSSTITRKDKETRRNGLSTSTTDLTKLSSDKPVVVKTITVSKDISSIRSKFEPQPAEDFRLVHLKPAKAQETVNSPKLPKQHSFETVLSPKLNKNQNIESIISSKPSQHQNFESVSSPKLSRRQQTTESETSPKNESDTAPKITSLQNFEIGTSPKLSRHQNQETDQPKLYSHKNQNKESDQSPRLSRHQNQNKETDQSPKLYRHQNLEGDQSTKLPRHQEQEKDQSPKLSRDEATEEKTKYEKTTDEKATGCIQTETEVSQLLEDWRARRGEKLETPKLNSSPAVATEESEVSIKLSEWRKRDSITPAITTTTATTSSDTEDSGVEELAPKDKIISAKTKERKTPEEKLVSTLPKVTTTEGYLGRTRKERTVLADSKEPNNNINSSPSLPTKLLSERLSELTPKYSDSSLLSDKDSAVSSAFSKLSEFSYLSDSSSPRSDISEIISEPRRRRERPRNLEINLGGVEREVNDEKEEKEEDTKAPTIGRGLENRCVKYGGQVVFQCQVYGVPEPAIDWSINHKPIKPSRFFQLTYAENIAQLVVAEAFSEDEGEYTCTATNTAGTDSTSCYLTVEASSSRSSRSGSHFFEGPVTIPSRIQSLTPTSLTVQRGQPVRVDVTFVGEPIPTVRWFQSKTDISENDHFSIMNDTNSSSLSIAAANNNDSGRYTVIVSNDLGTDLQHVNISVEDVPEPPVGRPHVYDVSRRSVSLSWCGPPYDGGSAVTHYVIEVRDTVSSVWTTLASDCKSTSYHALDLKADKLYEFRVRAANKLGLSEPSQVSDKVMMTDPLHTSAEYDESDDDLPFEPRNVQINPSRKFEDHYEYLNEVGRGKFGSVYKCRDKQNGKIWAAKVLKVRPTDKDTVRREVEIMNKLAHPKLLMLWDAFEAPRTMVLVMEFIGAGELFERVIRDDFELTERDCVHFLRQICAGVGYMHKKNILHLDLKPENILCIAENSNQIKIIDFGLARFYTPGESIHVLCGTAEFIAPEVINYDEIDFKTDMWSIGVICYILLSGLSPFLGDSDVETLANVTSGEYDFDDDSFSDVSGDAKDFIAKLLLKRKEERHSIGECEKHPWLASEIQSSRCKRLNTERLRCFMARRKWQKAGNAFRALGRMTSLQKLLPGGSGSGESTRHGSSSSLVSIANTPDTPSSVLSGGTPLTTGTPPTGLASPFTLGAPASEQSPTPAVSHPDPSVPVQSEPANSKTVQPQISSEAELSMNNSNTENSACPDISATHSPLSSRSSSPPKSLALSVNPSATNAARKVAGGEGQGREGDAGGYYGGSGKTAGSGNDDINSIVDSSVHSMFKGSNMASASSFSPSMRRRAREANEDSANHASRRGVRIEHNHRTDNAAKDKERSENLRYRFTDSSNDPKDSQPNRLARANNFTNIDNGKDLFSLSKDGEVNSKNTGSNILDKNSIEEKAEQCKAENGSSVEPSNSDTGVPRFLKKVMDCTVFEGDVVRFDVQVTGVPPPTLVWSLEDEVVVQDDRHVVELGEDGHCSLIVRSVTEDDEGDYTCRATNSQGEATCSAELSVYGVGAL